MTEFHLDHRLEQDTDELGKFPLCSIRLMNDSRWPWLILVPRLSDAIEIHELEESDQIALATETALAATALKNLTGCDKINTAAIGNMVRQLHIHVIARNEGDPNWPGPVWGFGARIDYDEQYKRIFSVKLREELRLFDEFQG